jgi:protein-L-isoaspartate(D-aspartate) O-methyltransferase
VVLGAVVALLCGSAAKAQNPMLRARAGMVRAVEEMVRLTAVDTGRAKLSPRVMLALERVPRHEFVPDSLREFAYLNRPLPIGEDQTISQPYIVALMSDLLDVKPAERVLEVGTGSGYQAAVLAEMGVQVWSIEIS